MLSERNGLQLFPYKGSHKGLFFFGGEIAQDFVALAGDVDGNLIGHGRCRRTGAGGEGEDVQISEGQVFDEAAGGFEFGVGLTGESGHDVGADGGDGHGGVNFFDLLAIVPGTIFAVHAAKHGVTAGLQRDVRVLGDARRGGDEGDEIVGPIHRFDGRDAKLFQSSFGENGANEGLESLVVSRWSLAVHGAAVADG